MNNFNKDEKERKGGFMSALTGLFKGGAAAGGAPGMGAAGGLFATKAGIVGMVLGGATIAAGVGVVYNFVGSSSKPVYSPELFQNSYYEEEAASASEQRAQSRDRSGASASTLDLFSEQAKKEGLSGGLGSDGGGDQKSAEPKQDAAADASAEAPAADAGSAAPAASGGGARLNPGSGFGGASSMRAGSTASAMPRMQNQGGLAGGIGGSFAKMYQPPAGKDGRLNGMSTARANNAKSSPKYAVPNFRKSGAYGQAKGVNAKSRGAMYSSSDSGARSTAESAFSGETGLGGDVGGEGGAGLGGAGISQGSGLKGNDPNLNSSDYEVPPPPPATPPADSSPWNKILETMLYEGAGVLAAWGTIKLLTKAAKGSGPWGSIAYGIAVGLAVAAYAAIALMMAQAIKLLTGVKKASQRTNLPWGTKDAGNDACRASDPSYKDDPDKVDCDGEYAGQTMYGVMALGVCVKLVAMVSEALGGLERPVQGDTSKMTKTFTDSNGVARNGEGMALNSDGSTNYVYQQVDSSTLKTGYEIGGKPCDADGYMLNGEGGQITEQSFGGASKLANGINKMFSFLN